MPGRRSTVKGRTRRWSASVVSHNFRHILGPVTLALDRGFPFPMETFEEFVTRYRTYQYSFWPK
jgi:hypothetical protein